MNEEEAIEYLKTRLSILENNNQFCTEKAIETVLNLLEKKDKQLEERTNRIRNLEKECQCNFDNMMDIMQENIMNEEEKLKDLKAVYSGAVRSGEIGIANMIKGGIDLIEKLQKEIEKKDKIIDEMTEYLASIDFDEHCVEVPGICIDCPKEDDLDGYMQCIKQYFERKVENGN